MLDSLYATDFFINADTGTKNILKKKWIDGIVSDIDTIHFYHPENFRNKFKENLPNNALFIVFRQYNSMQDVFEMEFQKEGEGDLKKYVDFLIRKYNK